MFTGLIKSTGCVSAITPLGSGLALTIQCSEIFCNDIVLGDSISINGVCSTVVQKTKTTFNVEYLPETLKKTTLKSIQINHTVNLEPCLTLQCKLGGHLVTGHIDTTGTILQIDTDDLWQIFTIEFPSSFAPFVIPKGSIALDGISLTLVDVSQHTFTCHIIPHTQQHTHLHTKKRGDLVNLEFDQVGKYLYRFHHL